MSDASGLAGIAHRVRRSRAFVLFSKWKLVKARLSISAAGVAFWALLSLFPALIGLVSLYGLAADPSDVKDQLEHAGGLIPPEATALLREQLATIVGGDHERLGLSAAISLVGAVWIASSGANKLVLTVASVLGDEAEPIHWMRARATAVVLTAGTLLMLAITLLLVGGVPIVLEELGVANGTASRLASALRWPLLAALATLGNTALYAACRPHDAPRRWWSVGALVGALLWLGGTAAFSTYVSWFVRHLELYGAIGSVVVLLLWLYLSVYAILIGAEVDAWSERRETATSDVDSDATLSPSTHVAVR